MPGVAEKDVSLIRFVTPKEKLPRMLQTKFKKEYVAFMYLLIYIGTLVLKCYVHFMFLCPRLSCRFCCPPPRPFAVHWLNLTTSKSFRMVEPGAVDTAEWTMEKELKLAVDFVDSILVLDPKKRPKAFDLIDNDFFHHGIKKAEPDL